MGPDAGVDLMLKTEPVYPTIDAFHINNKEMCASCHFPTSDLREYQIHLPKGREYGRTPDTWWVCDACVGAKLAIRNHAGDQRELLEAQCWLANYVIRELTKRLGRSR